MIEQVDVLIVGAGLSSIGAAAHLKRKAPGKSFALLEARGAIGGTWDLFRYPGIRSDSDMYTLGYDFRPWTGDAAIAGGGAIRDYVQGVARDYGIEPHIRFHTRVKRAAWQSRVARWIVEAQRTDTGETVTLAANFLFLCGGYYSYEEGYTPDFKDTKRFEGQIVHPQFWPEGLDVGGKRVAVIGSGATAVTLVPELAKTAAHVTMLQRTPTYMVSRPVRDRFALRLRKVLPARWAYHLTRLRNIALQLYFVSLCKRAPEKVKNLLLNGVRAQLGADYDVDTHFTPGYAPWDQRLCLVADGDLFKALRGGRAGVVTGVIERFTPSGLRLTSGEDIAADIVVTATGLVLKVFNGIELSVDGRAVNPAETLTYKGILYGGIPNLASAFGYTAASWTLKCDLTCDYVCRLLNHMDRKGVHQCTPQLPDEDIAPRPWLELSSGYISRSIAQFPKQGSKAPWHLNQNYADDLFALKWARLEDGVLRFSNPAPAPLDAA